MRERLDLREIKPSKTLKFLYNTKLGGLILRMLASRRMADLYAHHLNTRLSKPSIKKFIKKNGLDMSEYKPVKYRSFNEFFTREIIPERRPVDTDKNSLISPCDGKLTAFEINKDSVFRVKGFDYSLETLLKNSSLAEEFEGGVCLIFRLTVKDYHRYIFFDGGTAENGVFIKGKLHTVQPQALERRRVFTENCREYTLIHSENFGDALQIEVGAMFVGKIVNNGKKQFSRGEEKGWFEFGGSTIMLILKKGVAEIDEEIFENTDDRFETVVKCGEKIGKSTREKV